MDKKQAAVALSSGIKNGMSFRTRRVRNLPDRASYTLRREDFSSYLVEMTTNLTPYKSFVLILFLVVRHEVA